MSRLPQGLVRSNVQNIEDRSDAFEIGEPIQMVDSNLLGDSAFFDSEVEDLVDRNHSIQNLMEDYKKVKKLKKLESSIKIPHSYTQDFEDQIMEIINTEVTEKRRQEEARKKRQEEIKFNELKDQAKPPQHNNADPSNEAEGEGKGDVSLDESQSYYNSETKTRRYDSRMKEVDINPRIFAMKQCIDEGDVGKYEDIFKNKFIDHALIQPKASEELKRSSRMENSSEGYTSVEQEFWEDYDRSKIEKNRQLQRDLKDPIKLLEKLENYGLENLKNIAMSEKEVLLNNIENLLKEGLTPLERFKEELLKHCSLPSSAVIQSDKKFFLKHVEKIRHAHKQDTKNILKKAEITAKRLLEKMSTRVMEALKKEIDGILYEYSRIKSQLVEAEHQLEKYVTIQKDQEMFLIDVQLQTVIESGLNTKRGTREMKELVRKRQILFDRLFKDSPNYYKKHADPKRHTSKIIMELQKPELESLRKDQEEALDEFNSNFMSKFKFFNLQQTRKAGQATTILYYKTMIAQLNKKIEERDHEVESCLSMNSYYQDQVKVVQEQCLELSAEINRLKDLLSRNKQDHKKQMRNIKEKFIADKKKEDAKKSNWIAIASEELKVRDTIQNMFLAREQQAIAEIKTLKDVIKIPRAHFKNLERINYSNIVSQKKQIEKNSLKIARKNLAKGRYKPSHLKNHSVDIPNLLGGVKNINLPCVDRSRRFGLKKQSVTSNKNRMLSHEASNTETPRGISTNPSQGLLLEYSRNNERRFISPNPRTLANSIYINDSQTTLFSNLG
ncbi:unnamed protein product [Moneuplotes crassus]|uniref:Uncharacterized protein n=1 Tax=Euplotes crassus TaxID=5936 RepID=A0AAD1Y931_EUPCR|nr:unnamed protein product [Moneuplotes crassus]